MAQDLRAVLETLDDVIRAYKQRIAELEAIVASQQAQIEKSKLQQAPVGEEQC